MENFIRIRGARQHNLRGVDADIPKNSLTVITGPSGSGKSSLAFDTLYAEGQRRYVESLSAYARQFLGMQDKPDVEEITGLSPAISIEQKGTGHNPRSTVGTVTEVYDYLRLLFSRAGQPYCPSCQVPVERHSVDQMVDLVFLRFGGDRVQVYAPMVRGKKGEFRNLFDSLRSQGFSRVRVDGELLWLEEEISLDKRRRHLIHVLVDRFTLSEDNRSRLFEAIEAALRLSGGFVLFEASEQSLELTENHVCPRCGESVPELDPALFSFNSPKGACPKCSGLGSHEFFSEHLAIVPDLGVFQGAILPWRNGHYMLAKLERLAKAMRMDLSSPYGQLPREVKEVILHGSSTRLSLPFGGEGDEYLGRYEGLIPWLERRWERTESDSVREELARYREEAPCPSCGGKRLRREALAVRLGGYTIDALAEMPVDRLITAFQGMDIDPSRMSIIKVALEEVRKRLSFLSNVGAGYLSLSRRADTLSGGETQRIRLATQIGSSLTGVMYVLDEPTIGLHPRDTSRLLDSLKAIRDLGNTVIMVEHDRETMEAADYLMELGPGAGELGGTVVAMDYKDQFIKGDSSTARYLRGEEDGVVLPPGGRRVPQGAILVRGCRENNLKGVDVELPLRVMGAITGVSGSGKSTFLYEILYKGLKGLLDRSFRLRPGDFDSMEGYQGIRNVILVDQSPIGRTPRSNPATYTGVFSAIREFFASLPEAKLRGYEMGRFSFNVKGGRCEACKGEGVIRVPMLFLPDSYVTCQVCGGRRYNRETLEVRYKGLSIADVLDLSVQEALELFKDIPKIAGRLSTLEEAGLGYIKLGQPATTLSGGEAQRVKLAEELGKRFRGHTLYLLDEPTTGLYYKDVKKLLTLLHRLVDQGNTVWIIEHNLEVLASADYLVDLGPEGGDGGGDVVVTGTPEEVASSGRGYTAGFLADMLIRRREDL
ncbi:excinuclease ABC, A subunit [Thermanaerovibrio acidaminovorans DSM 6589]|uniref:UvrABC system protein A n=1 Tax=Thermanaerovibrio acidaminovorans (strain ATCC 49978 / DSM 6589 / Su883) TaxID=525903 RepID=D1B9Y0_THEAS|nr:excinuclease ABC subunit UvrA [Thermanaerovibrio acidaminovorans]ACZ19083.1 excinuclease ABC, A subunit [Thermanaerovibrio acidaminovorans DSM 6589]